MKKRLILIFTLILVISTSITPSFALNNSNGKIVINNNETNSTFRFTKKVNKNELYAELKAIEQSYLQINNLENYEVTSNKLEYSTSGNFAGAAKTYKIYEPYTGELGYEVSLEVRFYSDGENGYLIEMTGSAVKHHVYYNSLTWREDLHTSTPGLIILALDVKHLGTTEFDQYHCAYNRGDGSVTFSRY